MVRRRVRVAELRDLAVRPHLSVREPHALRAGHPRAARRPDPDEHRRADPDVVDERREAEQPVARAARDRQSAGRPLVEVRQQFLDALRRAPRRLLALGDRLLVHVDGVVADVGEPQPVGRPRGLGALADQPAGDEDLPVAHDGEAAVRCVGGVLAVGDDARVAAVPAHGDDVVVAVERDALSVRRPGRVRACRELPLVQPVDAHRVDGAFAHEREPAAVRRPRRRVCVAHEQPPMRPVGIGDPQVALRHERDALRARAPRRRVADLHHPVRADVDPGEREGECGERGAHASWSAASESVSTGPTQVSLPSSRSSHSLCVRVRRSAASSGRSASNARSTKSGRPSRSQRLRQNFGSSAATVR